MRARLIGYWSSLGGPWPDPRDFIDSTWNDLERDRVAEYLEQGFACRTTLGGARRCHLCGELSFPTERADGVFLWPQELAHYVRDHSVRLPDEVISHVTERLSEMGTLAKDVDEEWWRSQRRD
jgi:hypothetical protein